MKISLDSPEQEFVQQRMRTGKFKSPEEVVRSALSLLKAHEELPADALQELRAQIAIGINQADRGEVDRWDMDEIADEVERRFQSEQQGK